MPSQTKYLAIHASKQAVRHMLVLVILAGDAAATVFVIA